MGGNHQREKESCRAVGAKMVVSVGGMASRGLSNVCAIQGGVCTRRSAPPLPSRGRPAEGRETGMPRVIRP